MDLGIVHSNTRRAAEQMGRHRLRWHAWRARRVLRKKPNDRAAGVRSVVFESELTKRGVKGQAPRTDLPFHRLG